MEIAKNEIKAVLEAANKATVDLKELAELELSLVGGGCGEVLFG